MSQVIVSASSTLKLMAQGYSSQNPWALLLPSQTVRDLSPSHLPSLPELLPLVTPGDSLKQEENCLIIPVTNNIHFRQQNRRDTNIKNFCTPLNTQSNPVRTRQYDS